jgi:uncharacterized alpha-E superfamily protein
MYWMCRYIERAENTARFLAVNFILVLDAPDLNGAQRKPLVIVSGDDALSEQKYPAPATKEAVMSFF